MRIGLNLPDGERHPWALGVLTRTFDLYSVVPPGLDADHGLSNPVDGSVDWIAEDIVGLGELGFEEVRCDLWPKTVDAIAPVVELVHVQGGFSVV